MENLMIMQVGSGPQPQPQPPTLNPTPNRTPNPSPNPTPNPTPTSIQLQRFYELTLAPTLPLTPLPAATLLRAEQRGAAAHHLLP